MKTKPASAACQGRPRRGITLVEVCVALAITVVLATIAAPSLRGFIDARHIDRTATTLATDIQFARTEAVTRNQPLRLSLHTMTDGAATWSTPAPRPIADAAPPDLRCAPATRRKSAL